MATDLRDPIRFQQVYDEHARGAYAAAMRVLGNPTQAQDAVQDTFLRLWRRPEAFDRSRGEIGPYLRLMARSRALDMWREAQAARRAQNRLELAEPTVEARVEERPAAATERDDARAIVRAALHQLPEAQREAVVLAYWGGLTAEQIAARVGVPLGTAKSRIRLGLQRLRAGTADVLGEPLAA